MTRLLCPSMMCANFGNLQNEIKLLEDADIDIFHLDVMDGTFVPNFGMGLQDIEYIIKHANVRCDVHLMIENPGDHVDKFIDLGADIIYIHPEADREPIRTLMKIKESGREAGIAINPSTSYESIIELLNFVDKVMVMTVLPGFAGQRYIESVNLKIAKLIEAKNEFDFEILVDGAISPQRISELSKVGVDGFVLGTSALFGKEDTYEAIIKELRTI